MYSERDFIEARRRLRRSLIGLAAALLALLAVYGFALAKGVKWLAYGAGALLALTACYGILAKAMPWSRYLRFLTDLQAGGSREYAGTVVSVSGESEPQDGAQVLPVHLLLDEPRDERTFYLNLSKAEGFPPAGTRVRLRCCGRHILEAEALPEKA